MEMKSTTTVCRNTMTKSNTAKHIKSNKGTVKSPEPNQEAMEAWKRRKNYDPMAASGRKKGKELIRKNSASSSQTGVKNPSNQLVATKDTIKNENYNQKILRNSTSYKQSEPASAKSRSSESSGYISKSEEKGKRVEGQDTYITQVSLRKLAHTNSTSSLKVQSNRSSSCLTSKEAEFQAWKRRKNYSPLKSASRY